MPHIKKEYFPVILVLLQLACNKQDPKIEAKEGITDSLMRWKVQNEYIKLLPFAVDTSQFDYPFDTSCMEYILNSTPVGYPQYTLIRYPGFNVRINNYPSDGMLESDSGNVTFSVPMFDQGDTVSILDDFIPLSRKIIEIIPENPKEKFNISFSVNDGFSEQYDWRKLKSFKKYDEAYKIFINNHPEFRKFDDKMTDSTVLSCIAEFRKEQDQWFKNSVGWSGITPYINITPAGKNKFKMPCISVGIYENFRKKQFALKDTFVEVPSETENIATLIYKGKPCNYWISVTYLKFIRILESGKTIVNYLRIEPAID